MVRSKEGKRNRNTDDVDSLIDCMSRLKIDDPAYARVYIRALRVEPLIADILEKPRLKSAIFRDSPSATQNGSTTREVLQRPTNGRTRALPNTHPPFKCFGCNNHEHQLSKCSHVQDLMD